MIQLSGAGKRFGHKLLFENVDWLITYHDHIGLVGGNGTGKSTLMKVLGGMDTFDYGALTIAKSTSAGYLPQDGLTLSGRTVFAASNASLVLPLPPAPVRVSRRAWPISRSTSTSSRSRPMKLVNGEGR